MDLGKKKHAPRYQDYNLESWHVLYTKELYWHEHEHGSNLWKYLVWQLVDIGVPKTKTNKHMSSLGTSKIKRMNSEKTRFL